MDNTILLKLTKLEAVLVGCVATHEALLKLLEAKREAIRDGRANDVTELCRRENAQVQAISEAEKKRLTLVAELTQMIHPDAEQPLRLASLAELIEEPMRGRLLVRRTQLIEAMRQVQEQAAAIRRASESLNQHMGSLIKTIGVAATGGSAYGQTGGRQVKRPSLSTINLTA
jgi:hypothetical protein